MQQLRGVIDWRRQSLVEVVPVGKNSSITRIKEKLKAFPVWNAKSIDERHDLLIALAKIF
jgi:hypothetical protein